MEVKIADDAFCRCTPKQLTAEVNEAIRGGVDAVTEARAKILEPVRVVADGMAGMDEIMPGMASMRELRQRFSGIPDGEK